MKKRYFFLLFYLIISCTKKSSKDSILVINAKIWTGNPDKLWAEALITEGEKIVFIGTNEEVKKLKTNRIIDAQGKMMTPGFTDSHVHFIMGGNDLLSVQLRDTKNKEEFIKRIGEYAKTLNPKEWILSGTWDHTRWGSDELPKAEWIDAVTPNTPVFISRIDGHTYLVNSAAMKIAGLNKNTPNVMGGTIVRDEKGNPTGILKDNAFGLVEKVVPSMSDERKDKALEAAMNYFAERGITSVHNMGTWDELMTFRRAEKQNKLITRIYANVPLQTWEKLKNEIQKNGRGNNWLKIGGLKGFVDGSLGSHTAKMFEPFDNAKKDKGLYITPLDSIYYYAVRADKADLQVMVHAIGDEAIYEQLNIFERIEKENGKKDRRFRVEHAQHISPKDRIRFAQLKIIPSMQPYHAIDDGRWAEKYVGYERCKSMYAFRSLLDFGAMPTFGSDWFVAPSSPLEGMYAAITRRTLDNKNPKGWIPEQKISLEEALTCYTKNPAYASFDETIKGTLEVGKLADFVIFDTDLTQILPEKLPEVKVLFTVVNGKIVYERK